jgi:tetratricopeptide (TPR) repeat protein
MAWSITAWWRADREYVRAFRLLRAGQPGEAAKAFEQVLAIFPRHARAQAQRALALAAAGRIGEAMKAARRAAELDPKNHAPLLFLGQIQYDAGSYEEARKTLTAAAKLDPENQLVQAYLGLTLMALGNTADGLALLKAHLAYGYDRLEGRVIALAERYLWEHRDQARPLEEQLTPDEGGRDTAPAGWWLRIASALRTILLYPLARLRGRRTSLLFRATEAMSVSDFGAAIQSLKEAEAAGADPEEIALSLGQAYYEQRQPQAAAEQLARVPEEARRAPEVAALYGAALFESGRYEEARDYLTVAAERFRQEFAPAYYRGVCEIALGRQKEATTWFVETARRLNPQVARKRLEEMERIEQSEKR